MTYVLCCDVPSMLTRGSVNRIGMVQLNDPRSACLFFEVILHIVLGILLPCFKKRNIISISPLPCKWQQGCNYVACRNNIGQIQQSYDRSRLSLQPSNLLSSDTRKDQTDTGKDQTDTGKDQNLFLGSCPVWYGGEFSVGLLLVNRALSNRWQTSQR